MFEAIWLNFEFDSASPRNSDVLPMIGAHDRTV